MPRDMPSDMPRDMRSDMPPGMQSDMPSDMRCDMPRDMPADMPSDMTGGVTGRPPTGRESWPLPVYREVTHGRGQRFTDGQKSG